MKSYFKEGKVLDLLRKKSVNNLIADVEKKENALKRTLGAFDLTLLGIGAIIGTGIFVLTGTAAAKFAGPALVLSFIIAGLACGFAALAYAEFASMIPVAGSAYTYSYVTLGELAAWIIGWDLILEYALACSTVAIGWSGYFVKLMDGLGVHLPAWAVNAPGTPGGGEINIPAIVISLLVTLLLSMGVKESARFNNIIVFIKVAVVLLFIVVGIGYVQPAYWKPFMPFGLGGVMTGAAVVFFAYIGFDAVSTAAEEVKNPKRDLPIGIIGSLVVCTILYIVVSLILTGIVPYTQLNTSAPIALAMEVINQNWVAGFVSLGAISGITTVLLVLLYGQSRIFFAMSRDGLLPKVFSQVHPRYGTPFKSTWGTGIVVAIIAGFTQIGIVAEMVNIGTLAAFVLVSGSVIYLRKTNPNLPRSFKCPGVPVIPILAIIFCLGLMISLSLITWIRFIVWLFIGFIIYFIYGIRNSKIAKEKD